MGLGITIATVSHALCLSVVAVTMGFSIVIATVYPSLCLSVVAVTICGLVL